MNPEKPTDENAQAPPDYNPASIYPTPVDSANRKPAITKTETPHAAKAPINYARLARNAAWFMAAGLFGIGTMWIFLFYIAPTTDEYTMQWRIFTYTVVAAAFSALVVLISLLLLIVFLVLRHIQKKKVPQIQSEPESTNA